MIRRNPTKIELRLDDLQEYEVMKKAHEAKKEAERQQNFNPPSWNGKVPQNEIHERIGYMPQQNQQPRHSRPNI